MRRHKLLQKRFISKGNEIENKFKYANEMIDRLSTEIRLLNKISNTNLTIGILFSFTGIILLSWLTYETYTQLYNSLNSKEISAPNLTIYWGAFSAKILLATSISVLSFFFLSTYRRTLVEIKYFHNEMTNIQSHLLSLSNSEHTETLEAKIFALKSLAMTERNFIIKKGETTADIKTKEIDLLEINAAVAYLKDIALNQKKQNNEE